MADVWERLLKERGYKIQHTLGEGAYSKVVFRSLSSLSLKNSKLYYIQHNL